MGENKRKPDIRFQGFTDDWEQRKLGECGKTYTGLSGKTKEDFGHGDARFVTYMNVFSNPIADKDKVEAVEIDKSQNCVQYGDVFFTTSSETPEEVGMSCVWLESTDNTYLNSFCFGYRPTINIDPYFMAYVLRSNAVRKKIVFLAQGISRYNISKNKVMEIEISLPTLEEQKLIGKYFENLDNLITLQQRKYDKLVNVKKSMLEKMFPREGARVPEIRFEGFTDDWEQRKVSVVCSISTGKSNTQDKTDDGIYPFYVRSPIIERSNRYLFDEEAVLTVGDGVGTGKVFHYVNGKYDLHQRVYRLFDFVENVDAKFFYHWFSEKFYDRVMSMTAKTSVDSVRLEMISEMDLIAPSHQEQQLISRYMDNLDNLITLQQRKLEKLKNIKKSMLEKMFV
mgnify:CR=1 FL=1